MSIDRMRLRAGALAPAFVLAACGAASLAPGDVDLSLNSLNDSDFEAPGVLDKDENIGQGNANPWGDFIDAAEADCGGSPVGLEPTAALVWIDTAGSTGVLSFDELVAGRLSLHLLDTSGSDAAATRVEIASVLDPTGAGPVEMDVVATREDLDVLLPRLLGGDFHVGVRVETDLTDADVFSVNLGMTFGVTAYCR